METCEQDGVALAQHDTNDKAMKGMLMKAIRATQGEHLPQGDYIIHFLAIDKDHGWN